jgi:hypothetical protein
MSTIRTIFTARPSATPTSYTEKIWMDTAYYTEYTIDGSIVEAIVLSLNVREIQWQEM